MVCETYTTLILNMIRICKDAQLSLDTLYQDQRMLRILSETYINLILSIFRLCKDHQSSLTTLYQDLKDNEEGV